MEDCTALFFSVKSDPLTSDVREVLSSFPTVWASERLPIVLIQAGIAVDPPTACHLVWGAGHKKADLTHQFV